MESKARREISLRPCFALNRVFGREGAISPRCGSRTPGFDRILRGNPQRSFTVTFRCKPFLYLDSSADVTVTASGTTITNPGAVDSEPLIKVYGSGDITLMVGTQIVELEDVSSQIFLDSEIQEAYKGTTSMNSAMSGEFPKLLPGMNAISWTGNVTSIVITPRWRTL